MIEKTHDNETCRRRDCVGLSKSRLAEIAKAISKACRQQTAYFTSYTSKRQPVGKYELDNAPQSMGYLTLKQEKEQVSDYVAKAQRTNRMFSDLYLKGTLRTSQEEVSLCVNMDQQDVCEAESYRTSQVMDFLGARFIGKLEAVQRNRKTPERVITVTPIPVNPRPDPKRFEAPTPHVECYGYRGKDSRLYYLSPWEFTMWWAPVKLQPPVCIR